MLDLFFKIANFLLFAGIVIYLFIKKGISQIKNKMAHEKETAAILLKRNRALNIEYRNLQNKIDFQEQLYKELEKKMDRWQQEARKRRQERDKNLETALKSIKKFEKIKEESREMNYLMQKILPKIKDSTIAELKNYFEKNNNAQNYNQRLISKINSIKSMD